MKTHRRDRTNKLGHMTAATIIVSTMLIAAPAFAHDMSAMGGMDGHDMTSAPASFESDSLTVTRPGRLTSKR